MLSDWPVVLLGRTSHPLAVSGGCGRAAEAMAALTDVQRLQSRVEELERWVYGPGGTRGSRKVSDPVHRFVSGARTVAVPWPSLGTDATTSVESSSAQPLK